MVITLVGYEMMQSTQWYMLRWLSIVSYPTVAHGKTVNGLQASLKDWLFGNPFNLDLFWLCFGTECTALQHK